MPGTAVGLIYAFLGWLIVPIGLVLGYLLYRYLKWLLGGDAKEEEAWDT
jgi:hypothetical protein